MFNKALKICALFFLCLTFCFAESDELDNNLENKMIKLIVIDPGHGGHDSGAKGKRGTKEKDINLAVAKKSAEILKEKGKEIILTGDTDVFVPLRDRPDIANNKKADLFISIHSNAVYSRKKKGFEIYFLSENAFDKEAQAVADFENSFMEEKSGDNKIDTILLSMVLNKFMNESSELSYFINNEVKNNIKIESRGVKQAGFMVLRGSRMPAALVELAYISNLEEEKLLKTKKFQKQMANCIAYGILDYEKNLIKKNK